MYANCFTTDDIKRVFKVDCYQKDQETFLKTHYKLTFIFKDPQQPETFTIETEFLDRLWSEGLEHRRRVGDYIRTFVIWGATGTGKTELCRWLELNIKHPDYEPKRISKRELAMGGILGIAQVLSGAQIDLGDRLLSRHADVGAEDLAIFAIGELIKQGKIILEGDKEMILEILKEQIKRNIEKHVTQVKTLEDISKIETPLQFITKMDLEMISHYGTIKLELNKINREIFHRLIPFIADMDDVKKLMFDYIKKKNEEGKVPVLIFDDVTHLGDLVDEFISVISDISGGEKGYICDFIVGTTTHFYNTKFRDAFASTARARIYEVKMSPEDVDTKNANWLLGENGPSHFLEFVLRYLDAARNCGECSKCSKTSFIKDGYNYYPFTLTFLLNLYKRLIREKDEPAKKGIEVSLTPRFIIQLLLNVLIRFVETSQPPSNFIDEFLILKDLDFFKLDQKDKEKISDTLKIIWWYGTHSKEGTTVSLSSEIIQQLGLTEQVFEKEFEVYPLSMEPSIPRKQENGVKPEPPDDIRLKRLIREWYNGERADIPIRDMVNGFNRIVKILAENLTGVKSFRSITNYKSSREGEAIELSPPGNKECYFWIGELKIEKEIPQNLPIYILPKSYKPKLENINKEFSILFLDVDDFFRLYKIGSASDEEKRLPYIKDFELNFDYIYDLLWAQRIKIKNYLENQLGFPVEWVILSLYCLTDEVGSDSDGWPVDLKRSFDVIKGYREVLKDLFYSLFSLRGEGTILDAPLFDETRINIEKKGGWVKIIKNSNLPDERFTLSKRRIKFQKIIKDAKDFVNDLEHLSKRLDKEAILKELGEIKNLLGQVKNINKLIKDLEFLFKYVGSSEKRNIKNIISGLKLIDDINELKNSIDILEKKLKQEKDDIKKVLIIIDSKRLMEHEKIISIKNLDNLLEDIEKNIGDELEKTLKRFQEEYKKYIELKEVLDDI